MAWRVFAAAAIGKSHIDGGLPCQDAFAHALAGDTLVAVVCDGAGSKSLSQIGSATASAVVVRELAARAQSAALASMETEAFAALAAEAIETARQEISAKATESSVDISEFASTLVGVVTDGGGGRFFHVGDGLGIARGEDDTQHSTISLPENGEYANETYFVTGADWRAHLRVTPIAHPLRRLALMSDGAMPFAMAKGNAAVYAPFMEPVERFLSAASQADGDAALLGTLADPRTERITLDDKTLLIALRD
ncbi:MAG TPA: PP2C family serine/threonine-protein phosphatase [Luteimonas sp.]|nr:PP2C family serine/threonine-protein phosphatase [Luteimonas sp.]